MDIRGFREHGQRELAGFPHIATAGTYDGALHACAQSIVLMDDNINSIQRLSPAVWRKAPLDGTEHVRPIRSGAQRFNRTGRPATGGRTAAAAHSAPR
jgi:hypothetical protein